MLSSNFNHWFKTYINSWFHYLNLLGVVILKVNSLSQRLKTSAKNLELLCARYLIRITFVCKVLSIEKKVHTLIHYDICDGNPPKNNGSNIHTYCKNLNIWIRIRIAVCWIQMNCPGTKWAPEMFVRMHDSTTTSLETDFIWLQCTTDTDTDCYIYGQSLQSTLQPSSDKIWLYTTSFHATKLLQNNCYYTEVRTPFSHVATFPPNPPHPTQRLYTHAKTYSMVTVC